MKIRAGKKLWRRKPRHAPATIAERIAGSVFPSESARTAYVAAEIPHTPAASPSSPSRKLTMFITATIQSIVSGTPTSAGRSTAPTNGNVKWSIQTPKNGGIAAASTWPAELPAGLEDRGSRRSRRPSSRPPRRAGRRASRSRASRNASAGTKIPKKIASPPSRGIGFDVQAALLGHVDDAEEPRHPADRRRQQDHDHERDDRPVEDLRVVDAAPVGIACAYFVPYSRSPASPSPGTM